MTPRDVDQMSDEEYHAFEVYMKRELKARERAQRQARARR
jgi:hypothetical protein